MAAVNSSQYGNKVPVIGAGQGGDLKVLFGSKDIATALSAADTMNFFTAPAGFTPLFGFLQGEDLDTGTEALEIDIGISGTAQKYLNSGVISGDVVAEVKPVAGIWMPLAGTLFSAVPVAFTADTDIIGTWTAAANAGGTGVITLIMCGVYNDPRVV